MVLYQELNTFATRPQLERELYVRPKMPISADDRRTSAHSDESESESESEPEMVLDDDEEYEEIEVEEEEADEQSEEEVEVDEEEEEEEEEDEEETEAPEQEDDNKVEADEQEEDEEDEEEEEEIEGEEELDAEIVQLSDAEVERREVEGEEEEEDEEEAEFGEDLTPTDEDHKQDSPAKESTTHEDQFKSVSFTLEKPLKFLLPETDTAEDIPKLPDPFEMQVAESSLDDKNPIAFKDTTDKQDPGALAAGAMKEGGLVHCHSKTSLLESGVMNVEIKEPSSVSNIEPRQAHSMEKDKEVKDVAFSEEETKQIGQLAGKDLEQLSPRLVITPIRTRSVSPSAVFKDSNKRPAIICDFFAKGWCIKGNSCRFLHIKERVKDDSSSSSRKNEGGVAAANEGLRDSTEGSFSQEYGKSPIGTKNGSQDLHQTISSFMDNYSGKYTPPISSVRSLYNSQWAKSSSPFSPSWNLDSVSTHKRWDTDRAHFGSKLSIDSLPSSKYIANICSYNWEPSVPFKSEFLAAKSSSSLSPSKQYDPFRDSIEQTKHKDGLSKSPNKNSHGKDLLVPITEPLNFAEWKGKNTLHQEENISGSKSDKMTVKSESAVQTNRTNPKVEVKGNRAPRSSEMDVDHVKTDENLYQESRAFKHFRVALIEFVKDLVKPAWLDGLLSKNNHKSIVKKAVDKVLGSLPPNQFPSTPESTILYLNTSRSKIAKLVQGYVNKYGKYDPAA